MSDQDDRIILPFPISGKFKDNPLHNINVNIGTRDAPMYVEGRPWPPFPWALCRMKKTGDGKDSRFTPETDPDDHSNDDPLAFWKLAQRIGAAPQNEPAPEIQGFTEEEMSREEFEHIKRYGGKNDNRRTV